MILNNNIMHDKHNKVTMLSCFYKTLTVYDKKDNTTCLFIILKQSK